MRRKGVLASISILAGVLLVFSACDSSVAPDVEESFNVIQEVEAIEGGQNATMDLKNNNTGASYFTVDLSNIEPNNLISNSTKEAWCIEWDKGAINGVQEGVKLHSTKGKEGWRELNYLLTVKDQLRAQDPELTWKEIQVAIWSLVPHKPFDIDKIPTYQNFDSQFYGNDEYKFDVQKVKNIVSQVKSDANSLNKFKSGTTFEVFAVIIENDGQTVIVEGDETFWAFGTEYCFREDGPGQWGWVYGFDASSENNSESTPLVAGAGESNCEESLEDINNGVVGTVVGDATIEKNGDELTITLSVLPDTDIVIDVVHIDVDCDLDALKERMINEGDQVAPGKFPIVWSDDENGEVATEVTFTISISENGLDTCSGNTLYFAIHGVSGVIGDEEVL